MAQPDDLGEILFELTYLGAAVRVAAIHAASDREAVVMGPASAATADLERLALQKLKAQLARDARPAER